MVSTIFIQQANAITGNYPPTTAYRDMIWPPYTPSSHSACFLLCYHCRPCPSHGADSS
ncbi:unnamed protein product [Mycena citricolor]|uniref:Uncharacterized protein n=1 Tax=Mycena citricolor TaxID=2018698 RepID=A0AAD2K592_9AGAR|nr:unnamed protein product [Mycena citricolor]